MNQLAGLWRDTWFLWLAFLAMIAGAAYFVTVLFLIGIWPLLLYFCYFAFVRYDDSGQKKKPESES